MSTKFSTLDLRVLSIRYDLQVAWAYFFGSFFKNLLANVGSNPYKVKFWSLWETGGRGAQAEKCSKTKSKRFGNRGI
ncbi:MAG: hypothetical protein A3E80_00025 [Chlamydiae bacterium RIFCSPHIGHO2_12_FULL_49_9]|nr:MAG: hypothetical protein A3E80_00025 [Chlamydiae bacterium RIFCSPHIGHO2_12_FULL_49_9]